MKRIYRHTETIFERVTSTAVVILGNSITFVIALGLVIYWLSTGNFFTQGAHESLRDIIHAITFLSLFIIQKSFNRHSALLHLKVNELVSSHKPASNTVIHAETKTEHEIIELSKEYSDLAAQVDELEKK